MCGFKKQLREQLLRSFDDTRSHILFSRLASRDSSTIRVLQLAKGLRRENFGSRGSSTRGTSRRIDRSCSPFVMSRCNGLPIPEKECGGKPRERLTETRTLRDRERSVILKPLS